MAELKWQDPPKESKNSWDEIAEALRANPGRWALVRSGVSYQAGRAECRRLGLERRALKNAEGKVEIYVRAVES